MNLKFWILKLLDTCHDFIGSFGLNTKVIINCLCHCHHCRMWTVLRATGLVVETSYFAHYALIRVATEQENREFGYQFFQTGKT